MHKDKFRTSMSGIDKDRWESAFGKKEDQPKEEPKIVKTHKNHRETFSGRGERWV